MTSLNSKPYGDDIFPGRPRSITLKFTGGSRITLPAAGVTVFVGPNNSGKSLLLREIELWSTGKILDDVEVEWPSSKDVEDHLVKLGLDRNYLNGFVMIRKFGSQRNIHAAGILQLVRDHSNPLEFARQVFSSHTLRLDGRSRFNLVDNQPAGDWKQKPSNSFQHLVLNAVERKSLQTRVFNAVGLHLGFDATSSGQIQLRLSREPPDGLERSFDEAALTYFRNAQPIQEASDGIQAYVGILLALAIDTSHTVLLDEPEAFLHPPLARKLGRQVSELARQRGISLFTATHSADFLIGCVQAEERVRVVRLSYSNGKSQGRLIDKDEIRRVFSSPLMRSANALSSLFYDGVVVTESENDRAFYAEIYARIAAADDTVPTVLFIHAQNWQTCSDIAGPLRHLAVPAAIIMDMDVLGSGGQDWTAVYNATCVPTALHLGWGQQRSEIRRRLIEANPDYKISGGINVLGDQDREAAADHIASLAAYGTFIVPHGEVESWLSGLGVAGRKTDWAIAMLRRLGDNPVDPTYVKPATGDVWSFIQGIIDWVSRGNRKGMPL